VLAFSPFEAKQPDHAVRTVLCLGAHSDDIEIGCGGAQLHLAGRYPDAEFVWVVFSGDSARAREALASAKDWLRGVRYRVILESFRDGFFPYQGEAIKDRFEQLKSEVKPDLIFTHRLDDAHQDHRTLAQFAWNTFRNHTILQYEIPKGDGDLGTPNFYMPVSRAHAARKTRLLQKHFATQRNKHWFTAETFMGLMRLRGLECASPTGLAEGFYARKLLLV
jgi:LmbE family N-acetylglucosaminyl deacetylase